MADSGSASERREEGKKGREEEEEDDVVCLDPSFFVDRSYETTTFTFGSQVLHLLCLRAASTDYDLTGQLVWPGAVLMNTYLSEHPETVKDHSIIELGSGVGITGILCSRFCKEVVLTDHNDEVLEIIKKNIEMQSCSGNANAVLTAEKLEWGNYVHISNIIEKHPSGFDLILGADICFQQSSISCLFDTVERLLRIQASKCRFILAYVSRAKVMDVLVLKEAEKHGMHVKEVDGTRTTISNLEGVIYDITLK
ncbi:protein N-terminal and lysine N-methyltransferase efm7 [Oryza sativa Japonica Group]|uniref:Os07g0641600 protein n=3 Tax=Oryza sativa TaxID=4530 RepID=Q7XHY7_ORYSJ|nr:protein N-terminal and lysine N-methyltransferase efm7 isoform X1 [Oryza sativa Japonica Group]XP_052163651.1 protein N-terminal and lysine N-methyltransferase efm7 [Oryza glaberrima]EEC82533.1 hypothetical protein OsI_27056 [Oryza sativa Indica Group]KAB8106557.1 hypothetical protein EE612_040942 [Oryza sativa]KAF2924150.1 hypothetical protein DAI22_07g247500 [Oryza sativa Japonica Group]BAC79973.1 unknown protein [Oryza sativa Japonica Group]BAF22344.1 Os07g0641600 [Oryza sativa Japonica|eukprot:NP_001060430.1 Os07g0641600 [Oryza sativa Japonica Group]